MDDAHARATGILDAWRRPADSSDALAYRPLAEALTGIACPLPIEPAEVERHVAVARRNREYSAAHTDAMLPGDPPLLPGLLARAEALDARERAAFADRVAEWGRRQVLDPAAVDAADLRLAAATRRLVLQLPPVQAAVLCLRYGLAGDRPRRPDEVARALGMDPWTVRRHEAEAFAVLRAGDLVTTLGDVLDADVDPSVRPYP